MSRTAAAASLPSRPTLLHGHGAQVELEYASGHWHADRLGVPARRGRKTARFDTITQPWLRDPVKRWSRVRLATGCAFSTISAGALGLARFSSFLAERHPEVNNETAITRPVLEDYLSWLVTMGYSAATRAMSLSFIRVFFDACHRHGWLPRQSANAAIYVEELPYHHDQVARFIPEFVMAQLESDSALDRLPNPTARNLVVVLIETGLRIGDACTLEFSPMADDSVGWPCLRFNSTKVRAEQLIPLSAKAADAIRSQQDHDRRTWPAGTPWLFPAILDNADGATPYRRRRPQHPATPVADGHRRARRGRRTLQGHRHRFRHTLGTRLINSGVPQHVVQKLLGQARRHKLFSRPTPDNRRYVRPSSRLGRVLGTTRERWTAGGRRPPRGLSPGHGRPGGGTCKPRPLCDEVRNLDRSDRPWFSGSPTGSSTQRLHSFAQTGLTA